MPVAGDALEIEAVFRPGAAKTFGLAVRVGEGEETLVGYDTAAGRLFVDRTRSGRADFHPAFAGRHSGPLALEGGLLRLHVVVDRSSVEVFGGDGRTVISDRVFPRPDSRGVSLFAEGGAAEVVSSRVWPLEAAISRPDPARSCQVTSSVPTGGEGGERGEHEDGEEHRAPPRRGRSVPSRRPTTKAAATMKTTGSTGSRNRVVA